MARKLVPPRLLAASPPACVARSRVWSGRTDSSPIESLFFLEGLNYYHAGRYNQALAEFLKASQDDQLVSVCRFWIAKIYLTQAEYGHAYIELRKLQLQSSKAPAASVVARHVLRCTARLTPAEKQFCDELVGRFKEKRD